MFNEDVQQLFLVLFGKYLKGLNGTTPEVERWGLTLDSDVDGYKFTFLGNASCVNVDMEDLEIISNFFGTTNINIGSKTQKSPCKSCQFQTVEKLHLFINGSYQVVPATKFGEGNGILRFRGEAAKKYAEYVDQHTCV